MMVPRSKRFQRPSLPPPSLSVSLADETLFGQRWAERERREIEKADRSADKHAGRPAGVVRQQGFCLALHLERRNQPERYFGRNSITMKMIAAVKIAFARCW